MKPSILLLAFVAIVISSCTTAYKTGQTPDDVYFSPAAPEDEYVSTRRVDDRRYQTPDDYYDDRYLRMKVHNRSRWSSLDEWYYFGNRYNYSYYNNWNDPWNPNTYWNYYYNPYCNNVVIINPKSSVAYSKPRTFNLNTYNNNLLINNNYNLPRNSGSVYSNNNNSYKLPVNTTNSNNNNGNFLRNIFNSGNNNSSNSNSQKTSTSNNSNNSSSSSSSSSSSGSSSGSSAPVRRF